MPERLPLRRRLVFGALSVAIALIVIGAGLLAADLYLHRKYERVSVVNIWGYRGPTIPAKAPGEFRAVVLGGSAAFGYGVLWEESFPYFLEQRLNGPAGGHRFRVVNLAFNNEPAAAFLPTLEDYRYLDYDLVILYEGYNDLVTRSRDDVFRRQSAVFTRTGYLPVLPMIVREKYFDWRYNGDISRAYGPETSGRTIFRPSTSPGGGAAAASLDRQLGAPAPAVGTCDATWAHYCDAVVRAVRFARELDARVIVATQPYVSDRHIEQQAALDLAIQEQVGSDAMVARLDLGRTIDLHDATLAYDGMHLTAAGNRIVADAFVTPVMELASRTPTQVR